MHFVAPPLSASGTVAFRAFALCAMASGAVGLAGPGYASVPHALRAQGLQVDARTLRWLDPPGLGRRRALVLAAQSGAPDDLYVVTARTGTDDAVVALDDLSNLTRSPDAQEEGLVTSGTQAAFATRTGPEVIAFTLVDAAAAAGVADDPHGDLGARMRTAVTRWQQTGRPDGYGIYRFDLAAHPRSLALRFDGGTLVATAPGHTARVDTRSRQVLEGGAWVRPRPRLGASEGWTGWAVDTVRAVPWIGPVPIAWAEHFAFNVQDDLARARVRAGVDSSRTEVAEDLADVLNAGPAGEVEGPVADWPPAPLAAMLAPRLQHEGDWSAAAADDPFVARWPGAPPAFYQSFVRTDRERPDTRVYVTLWDPRQVEIHVVPGSQEPMGATGETGTGSVPRDPRTLSRLAAGFNGGFQALHGEWGVFAEGTLFLPPKAWGATIFVMDDGTTGFGSWSQDTGHIPADVSEFRQNLTSLVEDGAFNPYHRTFWGGNVPGAPPGESHTARTGLCLTREGFVGYFWGDGLTERSLADGMLSARCAYGIHLDMNGANTGFEFLRVTPAGATPALRRPLSGGHEAEGAVPSAPAFTYRARRMVRGMHEMSFPRYIKRDPRDFFYLLLRPVLPGPALAPPVGPAQPGEGQWHVAGLGAASFPWPMARTRVRPDPAHADRWVNLVRLDPRRLALGAATETDRVVARVVGATQPAPGAPRVALVSTHRSARWVIGTEGEGLGGTALAAGANVTRGVGIDGDGFLVVAVADRAVPDLVARALDLAGCGPSRLGIEPTAALAVTGDRDAAGASLAPGAQPLFTLVERDARAGFRMFPEVHPVPQGVWWEAQHRRVRYQRTETGTVEVNIMGGHRVTVPSWGGSTPPPTAPVVPVTPPP